MAEKAEFLQAIDDAILDADSLERFINGDDTQYVLTRLSVKYPTIQKAIKELFENGGISDFFKSLNDLKLSTLPDGSYAVVTDDANPRLNGLYLKSGGVWSKSKYDDRFKFDNIITQVDKQSLLDVFLDSDHKVYRFTDENGDVYLPNLPNTGSLQDNLTQISSGIDGVSKSTDTYLALFKDYGGAVYASFDDKANFSTAGGLESRSGILKLGNKTITSNYFIPHSQGVLKPNNNHAFVLNKQINEQVARKQLFPIAINEDDGKNITKRMPCGIKTSYGIMGFYHQKIEGYDGDFTGSQIWKYIIDIDSNLTPTLRRKEVFLTPQPAEGVYKHPHLVKLLNGDFLLMFEHRASTNEAYKRYQCKSSDEGLVWSAPVELNFLNPEPISGGVLGTVGVITRTSRNRLIMPMYENNGGIYSIYSDDEGATWKNGQLSSSVRGHEPSIIEDMMHEYLIMDLRPSKGEAQRLRGVSYDWGETWQTPPSGNFEKLDSAANQGTLFKDEANGLVIQTHNNTKQNRRDNYCLSVSLDGGYNFPFHYYPIDRSHYGGYSHIVKYDEGIYIVVLEYDETPFKSVNSFENSGILILNTKEIMSNVTYS